MLNSDEVEGIIAGRRESHGDEGLAARRRAEEQARGLLDTHAGRMSEEQARELAATLNTDHWRGRDYQSRFVPGLHGAILDLLASNMDALNEYTHRLWRGSEEEALQALDEIVTDRSRLPGAGRSYPSVLLYLRDNTRFAIWMGATEKGLRAATDYAGSGRAGGASAYLRFCDAAREFRARYGVEPELLDGVFADIMRVQRRDAEGGEEALLPPDAFAFLAELRENNTREWFDEHRARYRESLDRPLRRIFEEVAARSIRDLDPQLDTEVKRGHVMAALRRRFIREGEGEYHDYFWGAFSRFRKQEDVQLMIVVGPDRLRFGLFLGSASSERREALQAGLEEHSEDLWATLEPHAPALLFLTGANDEGGPEQIQVQSPADLARWAASPVPQLLRELLPDDPLATSPGLVDEIIRVFELLHPIARLGWGEGLDLERVEEIDEAAETEEYSLEQLAAETHLPKEDLQEWADLLRGEKRQALFYGPPGTGKTFVAERLARHLAYPRGEVKTIQFHPSFSYEDFIEGLRPLRTKEGHVSYEIVPGIFYEFCEEARGKDVTHVLIIDEMNRAELGSVLGELMILLEYRGRSITLPYSKRRFAVPTNVVVIGTMNTADRSLALVDFALRRRFHAIEMMPSRRVLEGFLRSRGEVDALPLEFFDLVQERVQSRDFAPGHSYWMVDDLTPQGLNRVWRYEIRSYLAEYWFEHRSRLEDLDRDVAELLAEEV